MSREILVIAEHWKDQIDKITYQMLTKGAQLAASLGMKLSALVVGCQLGETVTAMKDKGMDTLFVVDEPVLAQAGTDLQAAVLAEVVRQTSPALILMGNSLVGMELTPALAMRLGVPAMTNCVNCEVLDGQVVVTRPVFEGTLHAKLVLEGAGPAVVALQRGSTPTEQLPAKEAEVRAVIPDLASLPARSQVLELIEEPPGDVDITKADLLVSVGRGIGDKDKIPLIEALAEALGGVMSCSRPLVDLGFLPRLRQVGASGKSVAPRVYIACGISGASQHLAGMSDAQMIVAINKDPNAPIYQVAHYGVVADLFGVVPALTEAAQNCKE